ncbi:MAG: Mbeg1-like protein [Labrenzia sp.]|uniref:Mbeg1-like protein n=1 Tax=Roseibium alexandrii TaxID=388408 RepID=UPI0037509526
MALTPTDLTYAILSMDSYQRGAGRDPSDVTAPFTDLEVPLPVGSADAGFSATAYLVNGKAVISYRGTDTPVFSWDFLDDVWNGYGVGAGSPEGKQAELAIKFYQSVRDQGYTDIVLTGHSLGGGLAGMVASIYGEEAVIFDNMAFQDAASKAFEYATTGEPVLVHVDEFRTEEYEYFHHNIRSGMSLKSQ